MEEKIKALETDIAALSDTSPSEDLPVPSQDVKDADLQEDQEDLQKIVETVQKKMFEEVKENCDQTADHIRTQQAEKQINDQFQKLHQFLQNEEEARLSALREGEKQKTQPMEEKIKALETDIAALSDTIRVTEEKLSSEGNSSQQDCKAALEKTQRCCNPDDPQQVPGALMDVPKHLGNLGFNVWKKMKEVVSYTPVILDPNTAHPGMILSDDLTSVKLGKKENLPENPERITACHSVLGSEGFDSGTHSWVVEVGENRGWRLGVLAESDESLIEPEYLGLGYYDEKYAAWSPSQCLVLKETNRFQTIKVLLEYDKKTLSFIDAKSNRYIHTITHTFTKKLFPCINTWDIDALKLLPQQVNTQPNM
ncbi:nuclear factor 7, ovary-like [Fundulus heteroclitus]|uniref:nuclear factor 7, ovary-like n=1 Tax=Fundulus heteroclitus TaxID=8078 RepID=UPI00165C59D6|nr:nuclear factor 7, ovary-like [Fundulus heteroclitus]